jgi:hypothetical protein
MAVIVPPLTTDHILPIEDRTGGGLRCTRCGAELPPERDWCLTHYLIAASRFRQMHSACSSPPEPRA